MATKNHTSIDLGKRRTSEWPPPEGTPRGFQPSVCATGHGSPAVAVEVAIAHADHEPRVGEIKALWKARKGNTPAPLLLLVEYQADSAPLVALAGPLAKTDTNEPSHVATDVNPEQASALARIVLEAPSGRVAARTAAERIERLGSPLASFRNNGLLAGHVLEAFPPREWREYADRGRRILADSGQPGERRELFRALGFAAEETEPHVTLLRTGESPAAVAVVLTHDEEAELNSLRLGGTPAEVALAATRHWNVDWAFVQSGDELRLYPRDPVLAVGSRGRSQTYAEASLALMTGDDAALLPLVFSADALADRGHLDKLLEESRRFAAGLGERLRERVYDRVVPRLAAAIVADVTAADSAELDRLYEQAMTVLFRMLFIAYAEDRDLLPYSTNPDYQRASLKELARELANKDDEDFDPRHSTVWESVRELWYWIDVGHDRYGVPAYNGGLFSDREDINPAGAALARTKLNDAEFGPAVRDLLVDIGRDGTEGPVDFRSLSVREFGTVYEGLLESGLAVADQPLTTKKIKNQHVYVPAQDPDKALVQPGDVYLRNKSGARKATGSYFTKPFAVEHLLDQSLEPALNAHLERIQHLVEEEDHEQASKALFEFTCADIAMGSGHFLVAAVDRIESRFADFLEAHQLDGVTRELDRLADTARGELQRIGSNDEIDRVALLRRQIARRCVYGVDRNRIAVELARLAVWAHTFVPGLPLSFLDHNLIVGESLSGIGTLQEARDELDLDEPTATDVPLFYRGLTDTLRRAEDALERLSDVGDANRSEVEESRRAHLDALTAAEPARRIFDLIVSHRIDGTELPAAEDDEEAIAKHRHLPQAEGLASDLDSVHFPYRFPEVFLRDNPGFDCIVGNPPWEKPQLDTPEFWSRHFPGHQALPQAEKERREPQYAAERPDLAAELEDEQQQNLRLRTIVTAGPYPLDQAHVDLYKLFAWRFWHLLRDDGALGVVLPRAALAGPGTERWRKAILDQGAFSHVTTMTNAKGWVFDDVHQQYTVALIGARKGPQHSGEAYLEGPYRSYQEMQRGLLAGGERIPRNELLSWSDEAAFPLVPSPKGLTVYRTLVNKPRLGQPDRPWRFRPIQELNARDDKKHMRFDAPSGLSESLWPVYKGESFDIWEPDTGTYYAWAEPDHISRLLFQRRTERCHRANSPFHELPAEVIEDPSTLPCYRARIMFRDVSRATDRRTIRPALVPPKRVAQHKAPYLLRVRGTAPDEAYVLGMLSSLPVDWFARREVENSVSFGHMNRLPLPDPGPGARYRDRVVEAAGRLAAQDERFEEWAAEVGVPVATVDGESYVHLVAEIDALAALLCGLGRDELEEVIQTFHHTPLPADHVERVLHHYDRHGGSAAEAEATA